MEENEVVEYDERPEKNTVYMRVYKLSDTLNVKRAVVNRVITRYFQLCREDLMSGKVVHIVGFALIKPSLIYDEYIDTRAMYCLRVSRIEGVPFHTVLRLINEYLEICTEELNNIQSVTFHGLCSLHPYSEKGQLRGIRLSLSATINKELAEVDSPIRVRAALCKMLKSKTKTGVLI